MQIVIVDKDDTEFFLYLKHWMHLDCAWKPGIRKFFLDITHIAAHFNPYLPVSVGEWSVKFRVYC